MAKRYIDTELWNKEWFQELNTKQKCLFLYICQSCDCAGIWEPNFRQASFIIGENVSKADIDEINEKKHQFEYLPNGRVFITDFIAFQYFKTKENYLNEKNNAHLGVIKNLIKNDIDYNKYLSPSKGVKDMVCDKDIEKCFEIYKKKAKKILPLNYERRSRVILEELAQYLEETQYNFEYFTELCEKSEELGTIVDKKIDFRTMIRNHIGIMNGKYKKTTDRVERAIERLCHGQN